jgi:hypothetical protein
MLEDDHRSSMGEESLHHLRQILCKYYTAKVLRRKNEKNYDETKRKVRGKGRTMKKRREKNEKEIK